MATSTPSGRSSARLPAGGISPGSFPICRGAGRPVHGGTAARSQECAGQGQSPQHAQESIAGQAFSDDRRSGEPR